MGVPSQGLAWPGTQAGRVHPTLPGTQPKALGRRPLPKPPYRSLAHEATRAHAEDRTTRPTHLRELLCAPTKDQGI